MRVVALVSGGKDSIYTLCKMIDAGHDIVCCIYMHSKIDTVDSFMYQTIGYEEVRKIEEALEIPFLYKETKCRTINQKNEYTETPMDEVEDLYEAVKETKETYACEGVCSGAIFSTYQKKRVENVCERLQMTSFTPLWMKDQKTLLNEMISYGIDAIIVKIASPLLKKSHLGSNISSIPAILSKYASGNYEMNFCGEGGEFETITINCPHFKKKITYEGIDIRVHPEDIRKAEDDQVVFCTLTNMKLINN